MTVVVTGGLICSCGFQIIGVVGWLVVGFVVGLGFELQGIFWVSMRRLTKNAEHNNVRLGFGLLLCLF